MSMEYMSGRDLAKNQKVKNFHCYNGFGLKRLEKLAVKFIIARKLT